MKVNDVVIIDYDEQFGPYENLLYSWTQAIRFKVKNMNHDDVYLLQTDFQLYGYGEESWTSLRLALINVSCTENAPITK